MASDTITAASAPAQPVRDVDFSDPEFLREPWPHLMRLQDEAPVHWSETQRGWIVTRHEDVKACYADRRLAARRVDQFMRAVSPEVVEQLVEVRRFNTLNVNRMDGMDQIRIRTLLLKAFDRGAVRRQEDYIGQIVDEILARCAAEREFDFNKLVGAVLPTALVQRMFDLPDESRELLFKLASDFTAASGAAALTSDLLLRLEATLRSMNEVFAALIHEREQTPGEDVISTLVHARDGLHRLSHEELLVQLTGLVVAGAETTANSLGTQLVRIAQTPELLQRLRDAPECAPALVAELLRYPGTVKCMTRFAAEDIELGGQQIRRGDLIWIMNAAANVDPRVFPDPFRCDIDRENARDSMAFGPGLHHCVGHILARTELAMFFQRAFERFDVEILQQDFDMAPSYIFYGYRSLKVRFTPR